MSTELEQFVRHSARSAHVPGVAVGVALGEHVEFAVDGCTSRDNPLPVDSNTLFQSGSIGKTYTATLIMVLAERGDLELAAPVAVYLPGLRISGQQVPDDVSVLRLLNHTAPWPGDVFRDTGAGNDALHRFVQILGTVPSLPLGSTVSYNNAALSVAGLVVEAVTGQTFEESLRELVLQPLGLHETYAFPNEVMTHRFAVGHRTTSAGEATVARPWAMPRSGTPAGGLICSIGDLLKWGRFHLPSRDATSDVLDPAARESMQQPTVVCPGTALGDAIGISWLIEDIGSVRVVGHGGTTNGQQAHLCLIPDRDFALAILTNGEPAGFDFITRMRRWVLGTYLDLQVPQRRFRGIPLNELEQFSGTYETIASRYTVCRSADELVLRIEYKDELRNILTDRSENDVAVGVAEAPISFVEGDRDEFVSVAGPMRDQPGHFVRRGDGRIVGLHVGGRYAHRVGPM